MTLTADATAWLLTSDEPWTRYRALLDLERRPEGDPEVRAARAEMLASDPVRDLVARATEWPGHPLKRHNDAAHPLYAIATLADFGLRRDDPGIEPIAGKVLDHFDGEGFETLLWLPRFLTRDQEDAERWTWMLCDAPTLLYSLLSLGYDDDERVVGAIDALVSLVEDNGWRCGAASSIPRFGGPGRKGDTCPMATTYALKALSVAPSPPPDEVTAPGVEALLSHWQHQKDYKLRMFGIGTDFRKFRYPFVWYDILHVTDVLSRYDRAATDPRLREMAAEIGTRADEAGRHTAGAMYRFWKDWSFADKKSPSPWLTLLALRIESRLAAA